MALPTVWPEKVKPMVREVSSRGNQLVIMRFVVEFIGPSANPNSDRITRSWVKPVAAPVSALSTDQQPAAQR